MSDSVTCVGWELRSVLAELQHVAPWIQYEDLSLSNRWIFGFVNRRTGGSDLFHEVLKIFLQAEGQMCLMRI